MNKHTLTAPVPQRQLGCLITLCLLIACMILISSCTENYSNEERTGVFQCIYSTSLVFAPPDDLDIFAFFKESHVVHRITGNLIAIHVVKYHKTVTSKASVTEPVYCLTVPFVLNNDTRTRATILYILWNQLFYFIRSTRIHYLFSPLISFEATVKKQWQAYNEKPKSEPEQSGLKQFYRGHGRCLIG